MKVLISDKLSDAGVAALKKQRALAVVEAAGAPRAEILKLLADAEGLIVRSETQVDKELLAAAPKLRVVGRAGVGVDNIDIAAATERGIVVMNAPEGNTIATCELAFLHLMNAFRPLVNATVSMRSGESNRKDFVGAELYGKTLGIMGLGRIGSQVARRALAFGMKVIAFDPYLTADRAQALGVTKTDFETLLKTADAITLHAPLTDQTRGMINAAAFAKMKKGVRLINCARGELLDAEAFLEAVKAGKVASGGMDVFAPEPLPKDSPLRSCAALSLTPHLGATTAEAQTNVGEEIAESVAGLLLDGQIRNAVNAPSVSLAELERLRPFLLLGVKLGRLVQALGEPEVKELKLRVWAGVGEKDLMALSRAVMRGYLAKISPNANEVNAPTILERLGIAFKLERSSALGDYTEGLMLESAGKGEPLALAGALIGKSRQPRVVEINGVGVEISLLGKCLLVVENKDVPGIVGHLGGVLAKGGVNIANMTLGRSGKTALTLLEMDSLPAAETVAELKKHPDILSARVVEM